MTTLTDVVTPPETTTPEHHDNPVRGPFNSWILQALNAYFERRLGHLRDHVAAIVADAERIMEIGPGNGPLYPRLRPGTAVHAIEPNRHMHDRLRRSAALHEIDLDLRATPAEATGLADNSVDAVVSTWVLCTVGDQQAVLAEILRVLRPGGIFAFYEHVGAPHGTALHRVQKAITPMWSWTFEGCQTTRDTAASIRATGFADVQLTEVRVPSALPPLRTQIIGTAVA